MIQIQKLLLAGASSSSLIILLIGCSSISKNIVEPKAPLNTAFNLSYPVVDTD